MSARDGLPPTHPPSDDTGRKPLPAYRGDEPYVFVSYSHRNKPEVYRQIRWLQDQGIHVWFDEGIEGGDEWTDTLASAISDCAAFVYFISHQSVQSTHCRRELTWANRQDVKVLGVYIEETALPAGLEFSLGNRQMIQAHALEPVDYQNQLYAALEVEGHGLPVSGAGAGSIGEERGQAAPDRRHGILVLPFTNRSSGSDIGHICEGVADEIITALSGLESLRVISRGSAMQIAPQNRSLRALGKQLNVRYVLQGSVQRAGDRLRITAQLPSTRSDEVLWAEKWTCMLDEVFEVQETIARGVLGALSIQLSDRQEARLAHRPIPNVNAYEFYLRARQLIYQYTAEALHQALDYLERGAGIIGENAHLTAARGYVYWQFHNAGIDPDPDYLARARECIDALFAMDADSADAHRLLGLVNMQEKGDIQTSVKHLKIALEANPGDTDTLLWLPLLYGFAGRVSSGRPLVERLLTIDPLSTLPRILPGFLDMMDAHLDTAVPRLREAHELNPGNPITTLAYGQVLAMAGDSDHATEILAELTESVPGSLFAQLGEFFSLALRGEREKALEAATEELKTEVYSDLQYSWTMAQCFALAGDTQQAIQWLENAVKFGFWNYPLLSEGDPLLESLRDEPTFRSLMATVKDRWVFFEV